MKNWVVKPTPLGSTIPPGSREVEKVVFYHDDVLVKGYLYPGYSYPLFTRQDCITLSKIGKFKVSFDNPGWENHMLILEPFKIDSKTHHFWMFTHEFVSLVDGVPVKLYPLLLSGDWEVYNLMK